ncbi:MAG: restriction endonuclease subunit S [Lactobacillus iners]|nr:restriction endonuclease subunit S [Lactobacillus iners]
MVEWEKVKVGDIGKVITGKTPKTSNSEYYGGNIPFLTPSDDMSVKYVRKTNKYITEIGRLSIKNATLPANAICVSCIGSDLGKVVITTQKTVTNQQINSIVVDTDKFDIDFVYYSMLELGKILNFHSKTSTAVPIVNKSSFSQYEIDCPKLNTQKKIGAILSSIDNKIEENNQINKNLEEQIRIICNAWLNDYVPFGGICPSDWLLTPLSSFAKFISGYSYKGTELQESSVAMATIKNFDRKGGFKLDGYKEIVPSSKLKPEHHAELFDTLVAHTDLTQNAEVIGNAEPVLSFSGYEDIIFSMDVVRVVPDKPTISKFLIAAMLQTQQFKNHCLGYVNGTTVLHLSKKALPEYSLMLPEDFTVLRPLDEAISSMYKQMAFNINETVQLTNIRDALLPKLMSGELDVSDIDF